MRYKILQLIYHFMGGEAYSWFDGVNLPKRETLSMFSLSTDAISTFFDDLEAEFGNLYPKVDCVLREIRRRVYDIGLGGGPESLHKKAQGFAEMEQKSCEGLLDPVRQESEEKWIDRVRKWRSFLALSELVSLSHDKVYHNVWDLIAGVRGGSNPERVPYMFLSKDGKSLTAPISFETPTADLIDVIAFTEQSDIDQKYDKGLLSDMRRAAHEFLITRLITDDRRVIEIGSKYFKERHYRVVLDSMHGVLGEGRIGGKSAGMLIAYAVLESDVPEFDRMFIEEHDMSGPNYLRRFVDLSSDLEQNRSRFIGSTVFDRVIKRNPKTSACTTFKYRFADGRDPAENEKAYAALEKDIMSATFPLDLHRQIFELFRKLHGKPIILRSSSELEDRFGAAFAGKYVSMFLSNNGDINSDFKKFREAILTIFASVFNPDVMAYRAQHGFIPYDEEMGILIQEVNGEQHGEVFYPSLSGVAMSHATMSPGLDPSRGAMRLVHGLCDTAVDGDEGRFIMFDKPGVNINDNGRMDYPYQRNVSVIDLREGCNRRVSLQELRDRNSSERGILNEIVSRTVDSYVTFEGVLRGRYPVLPLMLEYVVQKLKYVFGHDVDVEFTAQFDPKSSKCRLRVVQCRPQNIPESFRPSKMPGSVPRERILLHTDKNLSCGHKENVRYVVYIPPEVFYGDDSVDGKLGYNEVSLLQHEIARLNRVLGKKNYIIVSPGRWGSVAPEAGIPARFGAFSNAAGFVEMTGKSDRMEVAYEHIPSFGAHFFQDVVESGMCAFGVSSSSSMGDIFARDMLDNPENNVAPEFLPALPRKLKPWIKVIDVENAYCEKSGEKAPWRLHIAQDNRGKKARPAYVYIAKENEELPICD